jgi:transcriptional regulator with XRE-family HTH domain
MLKGMKFNLTLISIWYVVKYRDNNFIKKAGIKIREVRDKNKFSLDDVAAMTGFTVATLGEIERGEVNTDISHIAAIGQALGVHPMHLINVELQLKPRFELPPNRENRLNTTSRVKELVNTDYFDKPRTVKDILFFIKQEKKVELGSSPVSGVLKSLVEEKLLKFKKSGRTHLYYK